MAYQYTPSTEEEEKKKAEGGTVVSAPSSEMSAGGVKPPTAPTPNAPSAKPAGAANNINKYLALNRDKVSKLGQNIAGSIKGEATNASNLLQGAEQKFNTEVESGTTRLDQGVLNNARSGLLKGDKVGLANLDANKFKNMYQAHYKGPQDIQSKDYYADANKAAQQATNTANLANQGNQGLAELVARQNNSGSGRYSGGVLKLDTALVGRDQASQQAIQNEAKAVNAQQKLEALRGLASDKVLAGQRDTEATRAAVQGEFDTNKEASNLELKAQAAKTKAQADYQKKLDALKKVSAEGVLASKYFDPNKAANLNTANLTSKDDFNRLNKLAELTGYTNPLAGKEAEIGSSLKYLDPNAAFNQTGYEAEVGKNKTARLAQEKADRDAQIKAQQKALLALQRSMQMGAGGFSISL